MIEQHNTNRILDDNQFLKSKPAGILLYLLKNKKDYGSEMAKGVDTTYSHMIRLLGELQDEDVIRRTKGENSSRRKYYELTEDGEKIAKSIENMVNTLQE